MTHPSNVENKQRNIMPILIGIAAGVTCFILLQIGSCNRVPWFSGNVSSPTLPVVKQTRTLEPFTKIHVSSAVHVALKPGPVGTAVVETHEDIQEYLTTAVENGTLVIGLRGSHNNIQTMAVELPVERLEKISVSSVASVVGEDTITADELEIDASSAGKIRLAINAKRLVCRASSVSNMMLSGSATDGDFHADGAAKINATQLNMDTCKIDASSVAKVQIGETRQLQMKKSSAATIRYQGTPQVRDNSE